MALDWTVPPGACDTHVHVYGPYARYPAWAEAPIVPPEALVAEYRALQRRLGLERVVVVQPSTYGTDNRCTLDAVAAFGDAARAVVVPPVDAPDDELAAMDAAGARGVRFHMLRGGVLPWDVLAPMAARVAELGWHVQLQLDGRELPERAAALRRLPGALVIDHIGKFLQPVPVEHAAFRALLELVDGGRVWVKLSAPYETSRVGPPDYADVGTLAAALVAAAPERMLWASNWPHPSVPAGTIGDDATLLALLAQWAPDEALRRRILVDNPAALYGFD